MSCIKNIINPGKVNTRIKNTVAITKENIHIITTNGQSRLHKQDHSNTSLYSQRGTDKYCTRLWAAVIFPGTVITGTSHITLIFNCPHRLLELDSSPTIQTSQTFLASRLTASTVNGKILIHIWIVAVLLSSCSRRAHSAFYSTTFQSSNWTFQLPATHMYISFAI